MFNFFKKKASIFAPVAGKYIKLEDIDDTLFSRGFFGNGIAIMPDNNIIKSPCDGKLSLITETKHAFIIEITKDIQILVHFGIDTISLNGLGFETLSNIGDKVSVGTPILKIDTHFLLDKGIDLTSIIVITNPNLIKKLNITQNKNISDGDEIFNFIY